MVFYFCWQFFPFTWALGLDKETFSWSWFGQETVRTLMNHSQGASELSVFLGLSCSSFHIHSECHHTIAKEGSLLQGVRMENSEGHPPESLLSSSPFERGSQNVLSLINQHPSGILLRLSLISFFSFKSDSLIEIKCLFYNISFYLIPLLILLALNPVVSFLSLSYSDFPAAFNIVDYSFLLKILSSLGFCTPPSPEYPPTSPGAPSQLLCWLLFLYMTTKFWNF